MLPYKDTNLTPKERAKDLLSRMTLEEKIGQLTMRLFGWDCYKKTAEGCYEITDAFRKEVENCKGLGGLYGLFRADPWSGANYETGVTAEYATKLANAIQKYVVEHSRLGIPAILADECPHGLQGLDGVVYPTNLCAACSFDPELRGENYRYIAQEIRARGSHIGLTSTLDILRDGRWGRSEECYGEDPYLAAQMTAAVTRGMQGDDLRSEDSLMIQLKHFAAQGDAIGGHNGSAANIGERELRDIHLEGMKAGIAAGARSVMASYPSVDGVYCHASHKLLTEILRDEMGFDGFVLSDGGGVDALCGMTGGSKPKAAALALKAGVDMSLWGDTYGYIPQALEMGYIEERDIDVAALRILEAKFAMGLFEKPYMPENAMEKFDLKKARESCLDMARGSVTLLENDGLLPINPKGKKIAVIGPNADCLYNQLGDYVSAQKRENGVTPLDGIKMFAENVTYARGCGIRDMSEEGFEEAINAAKNADVAVLVLGGCSTRDFGTEIDEHGAVVVGGASEMDCGEGVDKADLCLSGVQAKLAKAIKETGTPVAIVLIEGRPHMVENLLENCNALLSAWYPGINGGQAVAEVLFGIVNPSGRLAVSIPKSSAALPAYYNRYPRYPSDYVDMKDAPRYTFGYGLSYTKFTLSDLQIGTPVSLQDLEAGKKAEISVTLENTGKMDGKEVAQLYIHDVESTVLRRVKELKGFEKVSLKAGEKKRVTLLLDWDALALTGLDMKRHVEKGMFDILVTIGSGETLKGELEVK